MENKNPVTEARAMEGYSQERLGNRLGVSKQYISRAEQGTYSGLNKNLLRFVSQALDISIREAERQYKAFQSEKRHESLDRYNPEKLSRRLSNEPGYVLFNRWRYCYWGSTTSFSNAFCIHPEVVRNYEEGITPAMPDQVMLVLNELKLLDPGWVETVKPKPSEPKSKKQEGMANNVISPRGPEALSAPESDDGAVPLLTYPNGG